MLAFLCRVMACALSFACAGTAANLALSRLALITKTRQSLDLDDVLRDRPLCFMLFACAVVVISYATVSWLVLPGIPLSYVLSRQAPRMLDKRAARELRSACDEQVDIMADIVAMGVGSGLSFDASVDLYCDKFDNALARNMGNARLEWKSGMVSRSEALRSLSARTGSKALGRFADTSLQAIHYGSPLAALLGRFSADIRQRRRHAIERQIERAPVKLLVPTGTCILPAMLILVMGPVLLQFVQTGF